jgi:hypothetical protein
LLDYVKKFDVKNLSMKPEEAEMPLTIMDYQALRLDPEAGRVHRSRSIRTRRGSVRRRVGGWLIAVGSRMAHEESRALHSAADSS